MNSSKYIIIFAVVFIGLSIIIGAIILSNHTNMPSKPGISEVTNIPTLTPTSVVAPVGSIRINNNNETRTPNTTKPSLSTYNLV